MAVDLADVVSLNTIRSAMKSLQVVQRTNSDVDKLTQLFEGLNGIRFEIDISDKTQGKLTLDFEAEAHVLNKRAKEMMLELLGNAGAVLPEFRNWIGDVNGNEAFITGPLSPEGTRQLLSLSTIDTALPQFIQRRNPVILKPSAKLKTEELAEKALRHKSARYLSIITRKIRDLRTGRHSSPTSIDKYSFFVDRYARHIHRMSARGVDHEIANTGIRIADRLNNIVAAIQQAAKRTQAARKYLGPTSITYGAIPYQEITTPYQRYYYYAPFAFWRVNTVKYQELETKYLSELEQKAMEEFEQIEQLIELMNRQLEARFPRLNK